MARAVWTVVWFCVLGFVAFLALGVIALSGGDPTKTGTDIADAILSLGILGVLGFLLAAVAVPVLLILASLRLGRWTARNTSA